MQSFFEGFLNLSSIQLTLVFFVLTCVGGVLAALTLTVRFKLRRVAYLWAHVGACLFQLISSFLSVGLIQLGIDRGLPWIVLIAALLLLLSSVVLGGLFYAVAGARSNHILGSPRLAWQVFVPLLNLALFFRPGSRVEGEEQAPCSTFSRRVLDPILVVTGIPLIFLPVFLESFARWTAETTFEMPALVAEGLTLEESFAAVAEASRVDLPVWYDHETVLRDVRADGEILYLSYELYGEVFAIDPIHIRSLADDNCATDMFAQELARGGSIIVTYHRPGGDLIDEFEISQGDCKG